MIFDWENWSLLIVPIAVFLFSLIALFWLRRLAYRLLNRWLIRARWEGTQVVLQSLRVPSILWNLMISAYLGLVVSELHPTWKSPTGNGLWTLFLISVAVAALNILLGLTNLYAKRFDVPKHAISVLKNAIRIIILIVTVLTILEVWGVPTTPFLLLLAVLVLVAALSLRDAVPNLFAGFQLSANRQIKVGDYIKLETGEEGYVADIRWNSTHINALDGSIVIIPNSRLLQRTVINYGRPLKKAKEPFRFNGRTHLTELTGLKARNLTELRSVLITAPDAVVYYHTHRFLEEHHYLTPEPSNDFALWVKDALGDEVLGERLASIDTFEFPSLGALKEKLVAIINEHLAKTPNLREVMEDGEFHFMKSVSVIFPTPYIAHDLREFVEALRRISLGALYFHIFESRLRLGRGKNDFTIWLNDSLGESELGEEIARLDPYTYTLEGLRSSLIRLIEKRIK